MPPKTKISRKMILETAFRIVREEGSEAVNARRIAECLNCSTQPVMYNFRTVEEIRREVYGMADEYHTDYIMSVEGKEESLLLAIGLNYIRFAVKEPNLFRFLFQSGFAVENNLLGIINSEEMKPVLSVMQGAMGMDIEHTKDVFLTISMFAHGYASIIANNSLEYDEKLVAGHLERAYRGAVLAVQEGTDGKDLERS